MLSDGLKYILHRNQVPVMSMHTYPYLPKIYPMYSTYICFKSVLNLVDSQDHAAKTHRLYQPSDSEFFSVSSLEISRHLSISFHFSKAFVLHCRCGLRVPLNELMAVYCLLAGPLKPAVLCGFHRCRAATMRTGHSWWACFFVFRAGRRAHKAHWIFKL